MKKITKKKIKQILNKQLKQNKRIYLTSGVVIAIIVTLSILFINFNFSKAIDTTTLLSDQVVDNLKFSDARFENNKLTVVVSNTLDDSYRLKTIDVIFQDENYQEITTITGYIGNRLEQMDKKQLVVSTDVDLSQAVHIKYIINR